MKKLWIVLCVLALVGSTVPAMADEISGEQFIQKIDDRLHHISNVYFSLKLTVVNDKGDERIRELKSWQWGDKRLSKFTKPASDRGMAFLTLDKINNFVYLPASKKVRRIASHVRNQTFLGTDFTYEDMSTNQFGDDYNARIVSQDDTHYFGELLPKEGTKASYGKILVRVKKELFLVEQLRYFDKKGKELKVEDRGNWEFDNDTYWNTKRIVMTNLANGNKTILNLSDIEYDVEVSDQDFSVRNLKRPAR